VAKTKEPVIAKLEAQAAKGSLSDDVTVLFRLIGGSGDQAVDESIVLSSAGSAHIRVRDNLKRKPEGEGSAEVGREEALDFLRVMLGGVGGMVPASEARFVPDSLVGEVTFAVGNEKQTYYFAADEEDLQHRGQPLKPEVRKVLERARQFESRHMPTSIRPRGVGSKKEKK